LRPDARQGRDARAELLVRTRPLLPDRRARTGKLMT
jgi:hypothetical protein